MEYQEIINLIEKTPNQPFKFRAKNWVKINDDSRAAYNTNSQIKFKNSMLKSGLCDYNNAYILTKGTKTVPNTPTTAAAKNNADKNIIFKSCPHFTDCISEMNNTQVDNATDIDAVMLI